MSTYVNQILPAFQYDVHRFFLFFQTGCMMLNIQSCVFFPIPNPKVVFFSVTTFAVGNRAGLQIRPMIKFEPDAMCLQINARYRALYDVVGNIKYMLSRLLELLLPKSGESFGGRGGTVFHGFSTAVVKQADTAGSQCQCQCQWHQCLCQRFP